MDYWGYQSILDCGGGNQLLMSNRDNVERWIKKLVKDIDMSPVGNPVIEYTASEFPDKAGFTVVQIIVTSSIVAHFVDDLGQIYLDVFSCKKFDTNIVKESIKSSFGCTKIRDYYLTRSAD